MFHYPVESDVILFLKHLVESLQPFAKAHSVALSFESDKKTLKLSYHPETVASDVLQLICRVVTFTPQNQKVSLKVSLIDERNAFYLKLKIINSGVNISRVGEITKGMRNIVTIDADDDKSTGYEINWHLEKPIETGPSVLTDVLHPPDNVRGFYAAVRSRMSTHFKKQENKMAFLASENPKEAVFLQKIITIINAHIDDETFDVEELARSMAMSRMHLNRRLKPLVHLSPAHYIRDIRLVKAKELIEKEDLSIGEICFKVGFQSQSHFTRAFVEKFGVRPTAYRKGK
jgi:AraC-like DNA-binding protein